MEGGPNKLGIETAPPAVSSNPSADTHGGAGTSTSEEPKHPKVDIPSSEGVRGHIKKGAKSDAEVSPPGERVDDEADGKIMKRQE